MKRRYSIHASYTLVKGLKIVMYFSVKSMSYASTACTDQCKCHIYKQYVSRLNIRPKCFASVYQKWELQYLELRNY
jgi:hypothetical protein